MAWFYYSGNVSKPIPVKKGVSVSVRPHSRIEILEPNLREVQALMKKGLLRRTGKPPQAKSVDYMPPTTPEDIKAVTPKSELARKFAEKGVTTSKEKAPKAKGKPEMTEGELEVVEKIVAPKEEDPIKSSASDSSTESDVNPTGADKAEVLSKADGSSDEITGSDESTKAKKGKKRRKK